MNFDDYEKTYHSVYAELAETVRFILEKAIEAAADVVPRPQSIQCRAKTPDSLKDKLKARELVDSQNIENECKDLAGARLIFYTNNDVKRFRNSPLIRENFRVDWNETKIHHPTKENTGARYQAVHYTVRLSDERAKLPEYAKFADMRCEIQIQTILTHAWSETSHDIVYKSQPREGFGTKAMDSITNRLDKIMDVHLLPAGYEFQRIQDDYERLQQGKELFDRDAIRSLEAAKKNNERHELLVALKEVLHYYDDIPTIYRDLRCPLIAAAKESRSSDTEPIDTPFGKLKGETAASVTKVIVEIFDLLRYVDIEGTLSALCEIYRGELNEDIRNLILNTVERLSRYDMDVWRQAGPEVQLALVNWLEQMEAQDRATISPILTTIWREVLKSEITGTSWAADSMTIHNGVIPVSNELKAVREKAITGLFDLFTQVNSETEKREVVATLDEATRVPTRGEYSNELLNLTLVDAKRIVNFLTGQTANQPYALLEHLEHGFLDEYRRAKQIEENENNALECRSAANDLVRSIEIFRDKINKNNEFVRYKTLVGFEAVFPKHWIDEDFESEKIDEYRKSQAEAFIAAITPQNENEWFLLIERCVATKSNDLATFPYFEQFIIGLAKAKPDIAERCLQGASDDVYLFLTAFLDGLFLCESQELYQRIISQQIADGNHLTALARHWRNRRPEQPSSIKAILGKAISNKDDIAVIECLLLAMEEAGSNKIPANNIFFRPAIEYLTEFRDARWVRGAWFLRSTISFFQSLSLENANLLLTNLLALPIIDHQAERILALIAEQHLEAVWQYFGKRLAYQSTGNDGKPYEAFPYKFYGLEKQLSRDAQVAMTSGRTWYQQNKQLFRFRGGRLLSTAFPGYPSEFGQVLSELVVTGNDADADFVLDVMQNYHGGPSTHETLKRIIVRYPDDESKLTRVKFSFENTDVVSGEFGMVEMLRAKKTAMDLWREDNRDHVRAFAEAYIQELDLRIASEQKRADERREMRRREFDVDDDDMD